MVIKVEWGGVMVFAIKRGRGGVSLVVNKKFVVVVVKVIKVVVVKVIVVVVFKMM